MKGPIYWHPVLYDLAVRLIYRGDYDRRLRGVVEQIEPGWAVMDVCCGTGMLARALPVGQPYLGLDFNDVFIRHLTRKGVRAERFDVVGAERLPAADVAVILGCFYQFIPDQQRLFDKCRAAARKRVIIAEPVSNMASSSNRLLALLSRSFTCPGGGVSSSHRFDRAAFLAFCETNRAMRVVDNKRDLVAVFDG